jgi:hypothetical protein
MHTAESLVLEPSAFEFDMATFGQLKKHKSPGINQIGTEFIKAGCGKLALRFINLLCLFRIRRNCLRSGRSR